MNSDETTVHKFTQLKAARYMALDRYAATQRAKDLCISIANELTQQESRTRKRKAEDQRSFISAVEAIVGDLLVTYASGASSYCFRNMMNQSFTAGAIKATTFRKVIYGLVSLGLIEIERGGNHSKPFASSSLPEYIPGMATRFRCSEAMAVRARNLFISTVTLHFPVTPRLDLVTVRSSSIRNGALKTRGRIIKMQNSKELNAQKERLRNLNSFLISQDYGSLAFKGLYRGFNMGDVDGFNWNKGGRLYAHGDDNFQQFKKADRLAIKINGSPVVEVDINASYLTILLALKGDNLPVRGDIYAINGLPRELVKAWMRITLGAKSFSKRWPKDVLDEHGDAKRKIKFKIREVEAIVLKEFPSLQDWPTIETTWADLMFIESEVVYSTLEHLAKQGIAALPIHDALLVPADYSHVAKKALEDNFRLIIGITPKLSVKSLGH